MHEISKTFGASRALNGVCLEVARGEVHALVGQNGCGKSTLVKILCGYHRPDRGGSVLLDGEPVVLPITPAAMRRHGVSVVHQDLGLIPSFTVTENIRLGRFRARRLSRAIDWRSEEELAKASLALLGASIDPSAEVDSLSAFARAEVAIARALQGRPKGGGLVMLDEASGTLPQEPRLHFHLLIRGIALDGGAVLLVSHQLQEVLQHADRVTVMREGEVAAAGLRTSELCEQDLLALIAPGASRPSTSGGGRPRRRHHQTPNAPAEGGADLGAGPSVTVDRLISDTLRGISFTIEPGALVGVTGRPGSGFEELPHLLAGAKRAQAGTLTLEGVTYELKRGPLRALRRASVALVPQARAAEGLALSESVLENLTLPLLSSRGRALFTGARWRRRLAESVIEALHVHPADPNAPVKTLSGGNQQKVLVGKWLSAQPKLLLAHEISEGVDACAKADICAALQQAAASGCAVLLASIDAAELAGLCDRVLVLRDGLIGCELSGHLRPERILAALEGAQAEQVAA